MLSVQQTADTGIVSEWADIWLAADKAAGYVAVSPNFRQTFFYGCHDREALKRLTKGKKDWYITLNAFEVDWSSKANNRKAENLKQIRMIGIDIDQYREGLSVDDALDVLNCLILDGVIPEPNLVLTSRGIQIFYDIAGGASPEMAWLTCYITEQFVDKLREIGADSNAKDLSRYMRVPESINSRNGAAVQPEIWRRERYTLAELQSYTKPLNRFSNGYKKRFKTVPMADKALIVFYKVNYARLADFERLIELRNGDLTHLRNVFLYMYSYHQAFILDSLDSVMNAMRARFANVFSTADKAMTAKEFERTVKSAYKDARAFFEHYKSNGYRIIYKQGDGIIKPYTTANIIEKLSITKAEQDELTTLVSPEIKRKHDRERKERENRKKGIRPMQEYNADRKEGKLYRVEQLADLMERYPDKTQKEYAEMMGVSRVTLNKYQKELKELI